MYTTLKYSLLPSIRLSGSTNPASASNITDSESRPWTLIGEAKDHLFVELEKLYWTGVERELAVVLSTLKSWHSDEFSDLSLDDETDHFVHGFDTFIDQVSDVSREFADRFGEEKDQAKSKSKAKSKAKQNYIQVLEESAQVAIADQKSSQLKLAIRQAIEDEEMESSLFRRTRMLLQALGLLDIEKLVEHRPSLDKLSFWKRPAVSQLQLHTYSKTGMPILSSLRCASCRNIVRCSMYRKKSVEKDQEQASEEYVCEDCYRESFLGKPDFIKVYKHCILNKIITPSVSRKICMCEEVRHYDSQGRSLSLFPVSKVDKHRKAERPGTVQCGLLKLGDVVAEAKYDGLRTITTGKTQKDKRRQTHTMRKDAVRAETRTQKQAQRPKTVTQRSRHAPGRVATSGTAVGVEDAEADDDIPSFLRRFTDQYPFGNVHMALRIGPVVVENGVAHTKGGALVTLRDPPVLHSPLPFEHSRCLALSEGPTRQLWEQDRPRALPKRFKTIMKQVVGSPFTKLLDSTLESRIIEGLIAASKEAYDDPGLSRQDRTKWLVRLLEPIIKDMKDLIKTQLSVYLESIVSRLLDPETNLRWSLTNNNCQRFCDSLIDLDIFGPLVARSSPAINPAHSGPTLYLASFVCRPAGYVVPKIKSKFDVPRGLTEEYLLRFRYGRHDEADIIDTLQEYWYDWGAFDKTLYKYQDLFPWDCTEAFGRYPVTCGDCNLAKHVWAFPFDSWSIVSLHLTRDLYQYAPESDTATTRDGAWIKKKASAPVCAGETGAWCCRNGQKRILQRTNGVATQASRSGQGQAKAGWDPARATIQSLLRSGQISALLHRLMGTPQNGGEDCRIRAAPGRQGQAAGRGVRAAAVFPARRC